MKLTEPYTIFYREDRDTYILSLDPECDLPAEVCALWQRRAYSTFPDELAAYRHPRSRRAAARGAQELIPEVKAAPAEKVVKTLPVDAQGTVIATKALSETESQRVVKQVAQALFPEVQGVSTKKAALRLSIPETECICI